MPGSLQEQMLDMIGVDRKQDIATHGNPCLGQSIVARESIENEAIAVDNNELGTEKAASETKGQR